MGRLALVAALRRRARLITYAGRRVECPCCERRFRRFVIPDPELLNAVCPWCGSHIRHRGLQLFLANRTDLFTARRRVLHLAPEHVLQERLRALPNLDYLSADLDSPIAMEHFDLMDIPHDDESFDAFLCSHVLEHVPDDRRALRELFRVLRPGGFGVVQVPFDFTRAETHEDPSVVAPEDRAREFWQEDHLRVYGHDLPQRIEEAGFRVEVDRYLRGLGEAAIERYGLYSLEDVYVCRKG